MNITVVGGTFTVLHKGHIQLLDRACQDSDLVVVGLTTDEFASTRKGYRVPTYDERRKKLKTFLDGTGCRFDIKPLSNPEGSAVENNNYNRIVVSSETYDTALLINKKRKDLGLVELVIERVPFSLGNDLLPISSSRIIAGQIDSNGRRITPVRISIATENALKKATIEAFFKQIEPNSEVETYSNYVTDHQPFGDDITLMALKRLKKNTKYDYNIAIEAGLVLDRTTGNYVDIHVCAVSDRYGNVTTGTSSGFQVPSYLVESIKSGIDMSEAFTKYHLKKSIGKGEGVIGHFSNGKVVRRDLIYESIRNAFIPRLQPDSYGLHFSN